MQISKLITDDLILSELGQRLLARRIELQLTQAELAEQAGVGKRTIERIEAGDSAQLMSVIRVLRVLDALPGLDQLIAEAKPRPLDLLKQKNKTRRRASKPRDKNIKKTNWSWGDDK